MIVFLLPQFDVQFGHDRFEILFVDGLEQKVESGFPQCLEQIFVVSTVENFKFAARAADAERICRKE